MPHQTLAVVLGLHSSGSSCLAGVLHHLGVFFGENLSGLHGQSPLWGLEEVGLATMCEQALPIPCTQSRLDARQRLSMLRKWLRRMRASAFEARSPLGAKYPQFACFRKELVQLCGPTLRVIMCDRPLEESVLSLHRRIPSHTIEDIREHQLFLERERRWLFDHVPEHHRVRISYQDVLRRGGEIAARLAAFLDLDPAQDSLARSLAFIDPTKRNVDIASSSTSVE